MRSRGCPKECSSGRVKCLSIFPLLRASAVKAPCPVSPILGSGVVPLIRELGKPKD